MSVKQLFFNHLKKKILVIQGAMGTMLQKERELPQNFCPEALNVDYPHVIEKIHRAYLDVGCDIIQANNFGGSRIKLAEFGLQDKVKKYNTAAIRLMQKARKGLKCRTWIAASIGPLGKLVEPLGTVTYNQAFNAFSEQIKICAQAGAELLILETFLDLKEAVIAVRAAKSVCDLPILCSLSFEQDGRTVTGTDPLTAYAVLSANGADVVGANCSVGPKDLEPVVRQMASAGNVPLFVQPNAGNPILNKKGDTVFNFPEQEFAQYVAQFTRQGVNVVGGCCGTTPEHMRAVIKAIKNQIPVKRQEREETYLASRIKTIFVGNKWPTVMIGERINPTGQESFREELKKGKLDSVIEKAREQQEEGALILDVNLGVSSQIEERLLPKAVVAIQNIVGLPVSLDTVNIKALENSLKQVCGRPLINSVTGERKSLNSILPLAKKYGAALVGLCLDEKGIPKTAEGRFKIAKKIVRIAKKEYGIAPKDIFIDALTIAISTDPSAGQITLETIRKLKKELSVRTVLGVSNISFGLPDREYINAAFLSLAMQYGLDAAIVNPDNLELQKDWHAINLLLNRDQQAKQYIKFCQTNIPLLTYKKERVYPAFKPEFKQHYDDIREQKLFEAIVLGNRDGIAPMLKEYLSSTHKDPLSVNDLVLIPALKEVGEKFNKKEYFLPQVLMSAETMQNAFKVIQSRLKEKSAQKPRGRIIFATVEGDIHDIGKNIVIAILKNYGYDIIDLGKGVSTKAILKAAKKKRPDAVGLSALMTTTMPRMKEVVDEFRKNQIDAKVIIGGAVVTEEYAREIKADGYANDALEAVKIVEKFIHN